MEGEPSAGAFRVSDSATVALLTAPASPPSGRGRSSPSKGFAVVSNIVEHRPDTNARALARGERRRRGGGRGSSGTVASPSVKTLGSLHACRDTSTCSHFEVWLYWRQCSATSLPCCLLPRGPLPAAGCGAAPAFQKLFHFNGCRNRSGTRNFHCIDNASRRRTL